MRAEAFVREVEKELKQPGATGAPEDGAASDQKKKRRLFVPISEIKAEAVEWLSKNRIPRGRLTGIEGDPGLGKSLITNDIAARVSRGISFPDGAKTSPGNVVLLSIEDDPRDTIRPRLEAAGADLDRIVVPDLDAGLPSSLMNASYIESIVKELGPALVVIDPVVAFMGKRDSAKAEQVRDFLSPLMRMAEKYSFACLLIRHLNKSADSKALYRGQGSIDWIAAVRSAFVVAEDENGQRIFAQVKNSLAPKAPSLSFKILSKEIQIQGKTADVAFLEWGGEVDTDAEELLASSKQGGKARERVQLDAAQRFLSDTLANGPRSSNKVKDEARKAGIANATLWRAKEELDIRASKERVTGEWWWRLP